MRARNIKPAFFEDAELNEQPFVNRLLFIGLWCYADREGLFKWNPKQIKTKLFPDQDVDVSAGLDALAKGKFIYRYEVDGCAYGAVTEFGEHQNPHMREAASKLPLPPSKFIPKKYRRNAEQPTHKTPPVKESNTGTSTVHAPDKHHASTGLARLIPDSGFLIPDSLIPDPLLPDPKGNGNNELMDLVIRLQEKYPSMAISTILGNHLNKPKEIKVLCINRMLEKASIHYPAQYLDNILDKESAKHYARLEEQKSNEIAQEEKAMILTLNQSNQTFE